MNTTNGEMTLLRRHLDAQRRHVLGSIEGLSDEQLRRPVLPSGWHCLGLVRHLTLSDERYWFQCVVGGAPMDDLPSAPHEDWLVEPAESAETVIEQYRLEITRSDEVIAATALEAPPKQPDPVWTRWGVNFPDTRSVMMHVITETAIHAGHVDAVRELIDGRQWIVID